MFSKVAICPICGKRTLLRIQDGSYLNKYPIRVNCINCRALLKGTYVMAYGSKPQGLFMQNADLEECDVVPVGNSDVLFRNADYVAEISGELPCKNVCEYQGGLPVSPFLQAVDNLESMEERKARLTYFTKNMRDWNRTKSTAFQLLDEGSIGYIAKALKNKLGEYTYECDHYLKSIHCLQEVVLEEAKYLFLNPNQDDYISNLINSLAQIDKEKIHLLCQDLGDVEGLMRAYRKAIDVFATFMGIYPNVLPAETYMRFIDTSKANKCIATCSFSDIKTFYQDAYESLLSLLQIPICLDNIEQRGGHNSFADSYDNVKRDRRNFGVRDVEDYLGIDNGTRINKLNINEYFQKVIDIPANRLLRNGIGHNNINYDGVTQIITAFDLKLPDKVTVQMPLMDMAVDCIGLARTSVIVSEIILFLLRDEFRRENITTLIHPRFYKNAEPNMRCPCGSNRKYKKCCRNAFEELQRTE